MKAAYRLSKFLTTSILLLILALPAFAQSEWRQSAPFENTRAPWATSGSVVSAEHATPDTASRSIFESGRVRTEQHPRPSSGTVSVTRLQDRPPSKALKEVEKAAKAVAEGDREAAVEHYERAIEAHPTYVEAYNNLGVQCLRLGQVQKALAALERAVEIDPDSVEPHLNLAVALHSSGQLDAAAFQAEKAVELAPQSPSANMGLGMVLTAQGRNLDEAVRRLLFASSEHPGAALAAADALLQLGRTQEAHAALRSFLNRGGGTLK